MMGTAGQKIVPQFPLLGNVIFLKLKSGTTGVNIYLGKSKNYLN